MDKAGFVGILTSKFIVFIEFYIRICNAFYRENIFFKWVVYVVECIITEEVYGYAAINYKNYNGTKQEAFVNATY